ncbi:MAG TPA: hypothetical protein VHU19_14040 [Pyrinomonadaceae bacterium]|nr:hypothetical protein [Pyrinomonadaceae bacterium]
MTIDEIIDRKIKEQVDEALAPIRPLIVRLLNSQETPIENLIDALEVALMLGEAVSTEEAKKRARQKVYYLARIGLPYVRTGRKRMRFNPAAVRKWIAAGGLEKKSSEGGRNS